MRLVASTSADRREYLYGRALRALGRRMPSEIGGSAEDTMSERAVVPTDVSPTVGKFDKFADLASRVASRASFFAFCVLLVVIWAPSIAVLKNVDTWQLIINTLTTIVTFLMVALLQNSQTRADLALQHKLNAIADGLADLMLASARGDRHEALERDVRELRAAVGLEARESTANNETEAALAESPGSPATNGVGA
jgi:low affinity Fe/Cu permease